MAALGVAAELLADDLARAVEDRRRRGAVAVERRGLDQVAGDAGAVAIDRVGGGEDHLAQPVRARRLQRVLHAADVDVEPAPGIAVHGERHEGGEQQRAVAALHRAQQVGQAHHVAAHQAQARVVLHMGDRRLGAEGEIVEQHHLGGAGVEQFGRGGGADQARAADDDEAMAGDGQRGVGHSGLPRGPAHRYGLDGAGPEGPWRARAQRGPWRRASRRAQARRGPGGRVAGEVPGNPSIAFASSVRRGAANTVLAFALGPRRCPCRPRLLSFHDEPTSPLLRPYRLRDHGVQRRYTDEGATRRARSRHHLPRPDCHLGRMPSPRSPWLPGWSRLCRSRSLPGRRPATP